MAEQEGLREAACGGPPCAGAFWPSCCSQRFAGHCVLLRLCRCLFQGYRDPGRHAPQPGPQWPLLRTQGRSQVLSPPLTCRLDLGKFAHSSKPQSPVSKMKVTPEAEVFQGHSEGYVTHGTLFFQQMGKKESAPRESAA